MVTNIIHYSIVIKTLDFCVHVYFIYPQQTLVESRYIDAQYNHIIPLCNHDNDLCRSLIDEQ